MTDLGFTEEQSRLKEGELTRIVDDKNRYAHDCEGDTDPAQQTSVWRRPVVNALDQHHGQQGE